VTKPFSIAIGSAASRRGKDSRCTLLLRSAADRRDAPGHLPRASLHRRVEPAEDPDLNLTRLGRRVIAAATRLREASIIPALAGNAARSGFIVILSRILLVRD
jgi:hypothetical protein